MLCALSDVMPSQIQPSEFFLLDTLKVASFLFFVCVGGQFPASICKAPPAVCRDHGHWGVGQCAGYGSDWSGSCCTGC